MVQAYSLVAVFRGAEQLTSLLALTTSLGFMVEITTWNDILIRVLCLKIGLIFSVGTVSAQKALLVFDDEDKPHLVSETG